MRLERHHFDAEYIRRLVAGDAETERHFTRYFGELLVLKLRSRLRSPAQVEDARQETFVRVLIDIEGKRRAGQRGEPGRFRQRRVQQRAVRDVPRPIAPDDAARRGLRRGIGEPCGGLGLVAAEEREEIDAALKSLPEREQLLLKWLFFDERDKNDICRDLQIDRGYLRVLVHRAKAHFRERLALHSSR